jgi:transcriptional regulator with XRE-family HTH domain
VISSHLLREARLRAGLSQAELGRRTGNAASAISRWERGEVKPSLERLRALIRATGHDLSIHVVSDDDGHDLALIRRCLARAPHERLDDLVGAVRALTTMTEAAHG